MKFLSSSLFAKLTLAASAVAVLAGCDDPDYPTPSPVTASTVSPARVLVVNASPGSQTSTINVDNVASGQSVGYLSTTPAYFTIPAGLRQVGIVTPNNVKDASGNVLPGVVRQQFAAGSSYTVFSTDAPTRTGSGTDLGGVRAIALADNLTAPATGRTRVRFINLSPSLTASGANGFGLFLVASTTTTTPNAFLFAPTGRGYRSTSYTVPNTTPAQTTNFANFTDLPAGTYTVDVRATATATPDVAAQALTFASGKIYTVYVRGVRNNTATPLGLSVIEHN